MADAFIGEIRAFGFSWAPYGWFLCDGSLVPTAQYQALAAVIAKAFGSPDNNNFNLPNLVARTPIGAGTGTNLTRRPFASTVGAAQVTLTEAEMPSHHHQMKLAAGKSAAIEIATPDATSYPTRVSNVTVSPAVSIHAFVEASASPANTTMAPSTLATSGSGGSHPNLQPLLPLNFYICWIGWYPVPPS
ncbi:MAG: tail fiber protein [Azospirillaceae bacterium]|nr:tail fiber protein [Azospirillaceae bacterium]